MKTVSTANFAYLGWLIWTLTTILDRWRCLQMYSTTAYRLVMRLMVATVVAMMVRHAFDPPSNALSSPEAIAFIIGMFPERGIEALVRMRSSFVRWILHSATPLRLDMIEGVSGSLVFKFEELGVEDAHDLASANPITLSAASGLPVPQILDWVAQAQLMVLLKPERFQAAQAAGVRKISDFIEAAKSASGRQRLQEALSCDEADVGTMVASVTNSPEYQALQAVLNRILDSIQGNPDALAEVSAAAARGDVTCQLLLGEMYLEGAAVAANRHKAMHWLKQAAAQGNAKALRRLQELGAPPPS